LPLKLAEEVRVEADDRLSLAQEATQFGIWDWFVTTGGAICSEQYLRIYGLPASEAVMSAAEWLSHVHPEDRDHAQAYHQDLLKGKGQGELEFRIIRG
jgi:PAS domain-containing protein